MSSALSWLGGAVLPLGCREEGGGEEVWLYPSQPSPLVSDESSRASPPGPSIRGRDCCCRRRGRCRSRCGRSWRCWRCGVPPPSPSSRGREGGRCRRVTGAGPPPRALVAPVTWFTVLGLKDSPQSDVTVTITVTVKAHFSFLARLFQSYKSLEQLSQLPYPGHLGLGGESEIITFSLVEWSGWAIDQLPIYGLSVSSVAHQNNEKLMCQN